MKSGLKIGVLAVQGGMINHFHPNSTMNFDEACDKAGIPIISHETGH